MPPETDVAGLAMRLALQNATQHGGQANPGAIIGRIMALHPELKDQAKDVAQAANAAVEEVNALSADEQAARLDELGAVALAPKDARREGLPELPNAKSVRKVVMRFAPNPNGPPSLGHSRGMVVNGEYAKRHRGELVLRYDDTDPVNKPPAADAYDAFQQGFEWLGYTPTRVVTASERIETYYDYAEKALALGVAYTCTCEATAFRELKNAGEPCPHRGQDMAEQLTRWKAMVSGDLGPGGCVVRIKTDIMHKDPALRDWVALRIVDIEAHPHARTQRRYRVWPMLDFESAIEDHLQSTTHIIRGKDLADSERKQRFLYEAFGWRYPEVLHWGRVAVHEFGKFSTSQMRADIEAGKYTGWDDPRLPTLVALERRGFLPQALRNFWISFGLTEKDISASMENLESENRKLLDPRTDRVFFVPEAQALTIDGLEEPFKARLARHPAKAKRGQREQTLSTEVLVPSGELGELATGTVIRLKDALNLRLDGHDEATFLSTDPKEPRDGPIVQWVAPPGVPTMVLRPDGTQEMGVAEKDVLRNGPGDIVQFERYGFVRLERVSQAGVQAVYTHG